MRGSTSRANADNGLTQYLKLCKGSWCVFFPISLAHTHARAHTHPMPALAEKPFRPPRTAQGEVTKLLGARAGIPPPRQISFTKPAPEASSAAPEPRQDPLPKEGGGLCIRDRLKQERSALWPGWMEQGPPSQRSVQRGTLLWLSCNPCPLPGPTLYPRRPAEKRPRVSTC